MRAGCRPTSRDYSVYKLQRGGGREDRCDSVVDDGSIRYFLYLGVQ